MQVYYCDHFELPLPEKHRFPIDKYRLTRERVANTLGDQVKLCVAPAATREQLSSVHTADYLERVFTGQLSELEQKRIGFPWSPKMLERSRRSAGQTIGAATAALVDQIAIHLSGGTHHAFADEGQGFCVFNDIAVASRLLQNEAQVKQILVVDLDVHQGNGTAEIFKEDASVFTFSVHGDRNFPFRKTEGDLDLALPDGIGDDDYLQAVSDAIEFELPVSDVDFVFYLAGADPYEGDRMGRLKLTKEGLARRDELVISSFADMQTPIAIVLGGGYGPVEDTAEIHANTASIAYKYWNQHQSAT